MATDDHIDGHVSLAQCRKAITALTNYATKVTKQKEEKELLTGKEDNVWLVVSVKKVSPEKKLKPYRIPVAHPIVDPRSLPVCLITKDPQREYKDLLEANNIRFINRVVGVTKLKGKFKPFEARRMLMKENGLFLADERVVPLLPRLLGKIFFEAKKQPIPVSLTKKDLKGELERAVSSTYMHQNQGTCTSVKIGTMAQSPVYILDNLRTALPVITRRIDGGWDNIQSFHIKTNSSVSLPIWSCKLDEDGRWKVPEPVDTAAGLSGLGGEGDDVEERQNDENESNADSGAEKVAVSSSKGKKRAAIGEKDSHSKKVRTKGEPLREPESQRRKSEKEISRAGEGDQNDRSSKSNKREGRAIGTEKRSRVTKTVSTSPPALSADVAKDTKATAIAKIDITPDELRRKRAASTIGKKKEKIAKGKADTAKEQLLGKKAKSRI